MRCLDVLVADLGDVQQAADTADVDEGAIGLDAADGAEHHLAHFEAVHLALHQRPAMAEHQTVALLVDLQELEGEEVGNEFLLGLAGADVAAGDEAPQTFHPHQGTTPVGGEHLGVDGGVLLLQLTHPLPGPLVLDAADRERELAVFVLLAEDEELAHLTGLKHVGEVLDAVDRHLLQRHEGGRLGTDVDHRPLRLQGEHGAVDDVAGLEVVVVLAEQCSKFVEREADTIAVPCAAAAAGIVGGGHLLRNRFEADVLRSLRGGEFGSGCHGHGRAAVCPRQCEVRRRLPASSAAQSLTIARRPRKKRCRLSPQPPGDCAPCRFWGRLPCSVLPGWPRNR